ncbi:hypothetical protein NKJ52_28695 [Mesorhizobium australicum]|uniref:hypothetical protein n=1 Tax=Mesorhizobium australicum TaxID=536018 RepID=UPI0033373A51
MNKVVQFPRSHLRWQDGGHRSLQRGSCGHSKTLDLELLRNRFGPDAPAMEWDLRPKLKCEVCGSKDVGLIYAPDANKVSGMGKNLYPKAKGG